MNKLIFWILFSLFLPGMVAQAQSYKLNRDASKASVLGTSTLHDWESDVESFKASARITNNTFEEVFFEAEVKSIKSGKSGMDKNTYKAMEADKFPVITFKSSDLTISGTSVKGTGNLTIAGTTREIPVNLTMEKWNENSFHVQGSINIKMTDFGVDPPTAMMGTIKTGDDIEVKIELSLNN